MTTTTIASIFVHCGLPLSWVELYIAQEGQVRRGRQSLLLSFASRQHCCVGRHPADFDLGALVSLVCALWTVFEVGCGPPKMERRSVAKPSSSAWVAALGSRERLAPLSLSRFPFVAH
eukprot:14634677-Alexandrium_andersonii.AAC.3